MMLSKTQGNSTKSKDNSTKTLKDAFEKNLLKNAFKEPLKGDSTKTLKDDAFKD